MFFDRIGKNAPSDSLFSRVPHIDAAAARGVTKSDKQNGDRISHRVAPRVMQRRLMMIGLAANLAAPSSLLFATGHARAAEPVTDFGDTNVSADVIHAMILESASTADQASFSSGIKLYQQGQYEQAVSTLQQVNVDNLSDSDKKTYNDTFARAQSASQQRKAARAQVALGDQAMSAENYSEAQDHYRAAANNPYADGATQHTASQSFVAARSHVSMAAGPSRQSLPVAAPAVQQAPVKAPEAATPVVVAPAPAPAPAMVAPAPAPQAVVAAPVATPAPMPMPAPAPAPTYAQPAMASTASADQALAAAAGYDKIKQQQMVFQSQQLVDKARQEQATGQLHDAFDDYSKASTLDPSNQAAADGRNKLAGVLGLNAAPVNVAGTYNTQVNERIQAITYTFNAAIDKSNQAIGANDFAGARRALDQARVARNTDPTVFTQQQLNVFDSTIANTSAELARAEETEADRDAQKTARDARVRQAERARQADEDKRRTVTGLIQDARQLIEQGKYREALAVIDHIQALDPTNEYASSVRLLIEDKAAIQEQRQYNEEYNRQFTRSMNSGIERLIPYDDILRYPANWPDISAMRDEEVKEERGEDTEDAALQAQLDRKLPELRFNANSFSDVVDFLRDVTGANIYVDWAALERASISRDAPVTARLREVKFSKALEVIFKNVEGEQDDQKLGYTIDEGVITISTRRELNKNVIARRYDINDLLFVPPDYTGAPNLDITNVQSQSAGGGGGGGAGQSNIFQGGNGNDNNSQQQQGQREQRIEGIKKYIIDNVAPTSWKDNGGDVGSITSDPLRPVLLISQTASNHREIQKVLDSLRASKALQVSIETRFLTVQRNYLEDIGVDADFTFNQNSYWSKRFSPIVVAQNAVTGNQTFVDANGNVSNSSTGSRQLDWSSAVGNASVPGSIAANPADYPNPIQITGSYMDNFTASFLIRAVEANQNSTTLTAPRLTLFDGQRALIIVETQQAYVSNLTPVVGTGVGLFQATVSTTVASGVVLSVLATVSPDRKYVYLDLQPQLARLRALVPFQVQGVVTGATSVLGTTTATSTISGTIQLPTLDVTQVKTSCAVPDGATLLLGGQTLAGETTREQGVPVLSKIPFLKRLFTNRADSQDEQILLILVKPTILIQHEQEQKQFPLLSSKVSGS